MIMGFLYFLLDRSGYLDHWITPKHQANKVRNEITKSNYLNDHANQINQENFTKTATGLLF